MSFTENIKKYRLAAGLTQESLGERVGISGQAVSKWETGETLPDTALLPDIAEALGVSIDRLFDRTAVNREELFDNICQYIREGGGALFDVIASAFRSYMGENPIPTYETYNKADGLAALGLSSAQYTNNSGMGVVFENLDFPYAVFIDRGTKQDFREIIDDRYMQEFLFTIGDPDCFRCVRTLLTHMECAIEGSVLCKKSGVDPSRMDEVLGKLRRAGIVDVRQVIVNGHERTIVEFHSYMSELSLLPLFAAAYSQKRIRLGARRSSYGRKEPIIKE